MKYLVSAAIALALAGCNAESNAAPVAATEAANAQDVPQIVGNGGQPAAGEAMPPGNPMLGQLGEMGGAAEAAIEKCGISTDTAAAKRQQQAQFIQMGGTQAQFDTAYRAGYERARSEFESASAAERERMCDGYRQLQNARPGGDW